MRASLALAAWLAVSGAAAFAQPVRGAAEGPVPSVVEGPLSLDQLVGRLMAYTGAYAERLASVRAEEHYEQWTEVTRSSRPGERVTERSATRTIRSDYALSLADGEWIAYRDAFEVDGAPVRDRDDRLARILSGAAAADTIGALLRQNEQYNLDNQRVRRNINVPTLVLQLLHPRNRTRFAFQRDGDETIDGRRLRRMTFRERTEPTLIRTGTQDQPVRGTLWMDPATGEVWRTNLTWRRGPSGNILVIYGQVPDIDAIVPLRMSETYRTNTNTIRGEATYSRFRQFRTGARLLP